MGATTDDHELRSLVLDELAWDALVDATQVDASVDRGVVTLVGTVPSYAAKLAAQHAAEAVTGVHDLVNEIDVVPHEPRRPSDEELGQMVGQVLEWDALVPEGDLSARVTDGWVMLSGTVTTASQRREAERVVSHLLGVRGVDNRIAVTAPALAPDDVRGAIADALRRRATHRVGHIDVVVDGSQVTLRGEVQTEGEKTAVLGAVSHAPGVAGVCDELRVYPGS